MHPVLKYDCKFQMHNMTSEAVCFLTLNLPFAELYHEGLPSYLNLLSRLQEELERFRKMEQVEYDVLPRTVIVRLKLHSKRVKKMLTKLHSNRVKKMLSKLHSKRVKKMLTKLHSKRV